MAVLLVAATQRSRQAVDAGHVLLGAVLVELLGALGIRPVDQRLALADVVVVRHGKAARGLYARDIGHDDLAHAGELAEAWPQRIPLGRARQHRMAAAVQPQDARGAGERAEHKRDPPVLAQVRRGLIPAAGQVEVCHALGRQDAQAVEAFGREVHVPVWAERRAGYEEHVLLLNKHAQLAVDRWVELGHWVLLVCSAIRAVWSHCGKQARPRAPGGSALSGAAAVARCTACRAADHP